MDQGRYGELQNTHSQGGFGEGKKQETWICPECETKNTGTVCDLCGYQIKQTKDRKIDNTVERGELGNTALTKRKQQSFLC